MSYFVFFIQYSFIVSWISLLKVIFKKVCFLLLAIAHATFSVLVTYRLFNGCTTGLFYTYMTIVDITSSDIFQWLPWRPWNDAPTRSTEVGRSSFSLSFRGVCLLNNHHCTSVSTLHQHHKWFLIVLVLFRRWNLLILLGRAKST